jgi:hypothetical protein
LFNDWKIRTWAQLSPAIRELYEKQDIQKWMKRYVKVWDFRVEDLAWKGSLEANNRGQDKTNLRAYIGYWPRLTFK